MSDQAQKEAMKVIEQASRMLAHDGDRKALFTCLRELPALNGNPAQFNAVFWSLVNRIFSQKIKLCSDDYARARLEYLTPAWLDFADKLDIGSIEIPESTPVKAKHVVLAVHQILTPGHAPTAYALDLAREMIESQNAEVLIVNANAYPRQQESSFSGQMIGNVNPHLKGLQTLDYQGTPLRLYSPPESAFSLSRLRNTLTAVLNFQPDHVIGYGGFNLITDLLSRHAPTVLAPSTREEPIGRAHVVLGHAPDGQGAFELMKTNTAYAPRYQQMNFARPIQERTKTLTRDDMGLRKDLFLFAVVGNRLKSEIDRSFEQAMIEIMERCPQAGFVIVGLAYRKWKDKRMKTFKDRIAFIKYEPDLRALYQCCDTYFNPPRQGGGLSALLAMAEGCPVTACGGDVASLIGPDAAQRDWADQIETAVRLASDPNFAAKQRTLTQKIFSARPDFSTYVADLLALETSAREVMSQAQRRAA